MRPLTITTLAAAILFFLFSLGCSGRRPASVGVGDGRPAPCPSSPNCVSSMAEDEAHRVEPIVYSSDKQSALRALLKVLAAQKRAAIVRQTNDYIYFEFKSKIFRFTDDVEFFFPEDEKIIHVRSASRLGYSDLGVNRKRVELIRTQFKDAMSEN